MSWNDLRFFLELERSNTLSAAARQLDVEHTTVSRRIRALERTIGSSLFTRIGGSYALTEVGEQLLPVAIEMERAYASIERREAVPASGIGGLVRIGCTEGYGATVLPHHLVRLQSDWPNIRVDLLIMPRMTQVQRNEIDFLITIDRPTRGPYTVVKLSNYTLHLYASEQYLANRSAIREIADLAGHRLINYVDYISVAKDLPLFHDKDVSIDRGIHSTSLLAQCQTVIAGGGMAILPRFIAKDSPTLRAILPEAIRMTRTYWLVAQDSTKDVPRMRLVSDFLRRAARLERL